MATKKLNSAAERLSVPEQQRADDGRARARDAGHQRQHLEQPDIEAEQRRILVDRGIFRRELQLVDPEQDEPADDQHDADHDRALVDHALDEIVQQHAGDRGRQRGQHDAENEPPGARLARMASRAMPASRPK